jgi:polysaccharide biosynthesis protein PslH
MHIVWIKTELLHPVDKGGRIRTYQMLRALAREHEITYVTLDDGTAASDARERATEYCTRVEIVPFSPSRKGGIRFLFEVVANLFSSRPFVTERYRVPALEARIRSVCLERQVDVVVCDFLAPSSNVPDDLPAPVILFEHNVESMIWQRHADVATNPLKKAYFASQWQRMRRFEAAECRRMHSVIAVSEQDAKVFRDEFAVEHVVAVATGVDLDYFAERPASAVVRPGEMVFTGSMDWMPNEDGIEWFVQSVFGRIRSAVPHATLTVVGRNPTSRVKALHAPDAGITVTGSVPDVRPYLNAAELFIVPLRVGGGTRLKIYEGMAIGLPTVSTTIGAEGLPLTDGEHIAIADDAESFAQTCIDLLTDRRAASALGQSGAEYVREHCGWDGVARDFTEFCRAALPERDYAQSV